MSLDLINMIRILAIRRKNFFIFLLQLKNKIYFVKGSYSYMYRVAKFCCRERQWRTYGCEPVKRRTEHDSSVARGA